MTSLSERNDERINALSDSFFASLDDFKKYYVYYQKNPEVEEYYNNYSNSRSQLLTISNNVFELTKNIEHQIENLDRRMSDINKNMANEKETNNKLVDRRNQMNGAENGSEVLVSDSKARYNRQYYSNWEILLGIVIVGTVLAKGFGTSKT